MKTTHAVRIETDSAYAELESQIHKSVLGVTADVPLFTTNVDPHKLFDAYLQGLPVEYRQYYNCRSCQRFIESYGGLVTIDREGRSRSLLWKSDQVPVFFHLSVLKLARMVEDAPVNGVFINGDAVWGRPITGAWTHLSGTPGSVYVHLLKTADQAMAEKLEEHGMLCRSMAEYSQEAAVQAVRVLSADVVERSEKTLAIAEWFLQVHKDAATAVYLTTTGQADGHPRRNIIWRAVAKAPPGWCHLRTSMIGTLLEDIKQGVPFETIRAKWNKKVSPLVYQRPTAISDGAIEQANKIFEKLGAEKALDRRYARLDELTTLWRPSPLPEEVKPSGGVFDHLKTKKDTIKPVDLPPTKVTWAEFREQVLPKALTVDVYLDDSTTTFYALVTAVHPDSPPMLQWDGVPGFPRNPISWYTYPYGTTPENWSLPRGWNPVAAISLPPHMWQSDKFTNFDKDVGCFTIAAARDYRNPGGGYFPETVRSDYHSIKQVLEKHSRSCTPAGKAEGNANGIFLTTGNRLTVRVRSAVGVETYELRMK
jgi:hypothetical protein